MTELLDLRKFNRHARITRRLASYEVFHLISPVEGVYNCSISSRDEAEK